MSRNISIYLNKLEISLNKKAHKLNVIITAMHKAEMIHMRKVTSYKRKIKKLIKS